MGVVAEALHERLDVLVHEGVDRDQVRPLVELGRRRQLAVDEQVCHLEVARALGERFDRVSAVLEHPGVAIEEGDRAAARRGVHERRVVGEQAEVLVGGSDLAQIERADRALDDRDLIGPASAIVGDRQRIAGSALAIGLRCGLRFCAHRVSSRPVACSPIMSHAAPRLRHCSGSRSPRSVPGSGCRARRGRTDAAPARRAP